MTSLTLPDKVMLILFLSGSLALAGYLLLHRNSDRTSIIPFAGTFPPSRISTEVVFENLRQLSSLNCAAFDGSVFVRDSVPLRILGIKLTDAQLWLSTPGTVRASVDMASLTRSSVREMTGSSGRGLSITLPEPEIVSVELHPEGGSRGRSPMLFFGGNADAVAAAEDRLRMAAERELASQAETMGIMERAKDNARASVIDMVRQLVGDSTVQIEIDFEDEVLAQPSQRPIAPDWRIAG